MPLVSIVVPSYQQGRYIRDTLDSILSQDFTDLECIVMDGGSTDETVAVLQSITDPRLMWVSEPDRGQSHAINKGLARATGAILSYLNSDDLLRPGAVTAVVRYFGQHPEADLVYGDMDHVDGEGATFETVIAAPFDLPDTLAGRNSVNQPGTFWRREVGERVGPFDESLH
ncbi:MAG: glycosyltransferase family 2 protein, partial [Anaerolineae bacterium]